MRAMCIVHKTNKQTIPIRVLFSTLFQTEMSRCTIIIYQFQAYPLGHCNTKTASASVTHCMRCYRGDLDPDAPAPFLAQVSSDLSFQYSCNSLPCPGQL